MWKTKKKKWKKRNPCKGKREERNQIYGCLFISDNHRPWTSLKHGSLSQQNENDKGKIVKMQSQIGKEENLPQKEEKLNSTKQISAPTESDWNLSLQISLYYAVCEWIFAASSFILFSFLIFSLSVWVTWRKGCLCCRGIYRGRMTVTVTVTEVWGFYSWVSFNGADHTLTEHSWFFQLSASAPAKHGAVLHTLCFGAWRE